MIKLLDTKSFIALWSFPRSLSLTVVSHEEFKTQRIELYRALNSQK